MKNEQITLVVLAYLIGFVTAYIAFGLNSPAQESVVPIKVAPTANSQADSRSTGNVDAVQELADGLYAVIGNHERVLSAQAATAVTATPGFHHSIRNASVSPDSRFVYYCAQETEAEDRCSHYVYDSVSDTVRAVIDTNGTRVTSPLAAAGDWSLDGALYLNEYRSKNSATPWLVVQR